MEIAKRPNVLTHSQFSRTWASESGAKKITVMRVIQAAVLYPPINRMERRACCPIPRMTIATSKEKFVAHFLLVGPKKSLSRGPGEQCRRQYGQERITLSGSPFFPLRARLPASLLAAGSKSQSMPASPSVCWCTRGRLRRPGTSSFLGRSNEPGICAKLTGVLLAGERPSARSTLLLRLANDLFVSTAEPPYQNRYAPRMYPSCPREMSASTGPIDTWKYANSEGPAPVRKQLDVVRPYAIKRLRSN